jgi:hypothetical protein
VIAKGCEDRPRPANPISLTVTPEATGSSSAPWAASRSGALGHSQGTHRLDLVPGHAQRHRPLLDGRAGFQEQIRGHPGKGQLPARRLAISWPIRFRNRSFEPITRVIAPRSS